MYKIVLNRRPREAPKRLSGTSQAPTRPQGEVRERLDDGLREVMGRLEVAASAYRQVGDGLRRLCEQS